MEIYHTETQADYDALMVELEKRGVSWFNGVQMTKKPDSWGVHEKHTYVRVDGFNAFYDSDYFHEWRYPETPITKYKKRKMRKMEIYHTETQADYDALMVKLEEDGCQWELGKKKPTETNRWEFFKEETSIRVVDKIIRRSNIHYYRNRFLNVPIIKFKSENKSPNTMTETIVAYYKNKRKTENVDTALNMTISNFWLNTKLLKALSKYIQENEK